MPAYTASCLEVTDPSVHRFRVCEKAEPMLRRLRPRARRPSSSQARGPSQATLSHGGASTAQAYAPSALLKSHTLLSSLSSYTLRAFAHSKAFAHFQSLCILSSLCHSNACASLTPPLLPCLRPWKVQAGGPEPAHALPRPVPPLHDPPPPAPGRHTQGPALPTALPLKQRRRGGSGPLSCGWDDHQGALPQQGKHGPIHPTSPHHAALCHS
jgi:hypothetical protein